MKAETYEYVILEIGNHSCQQDSDAIQNHYFPVFNQHVNRFSLCVNLISKVTWIPFFPCQEFIFYFLIIVSSVLQTSGKTLAWLLNCVK